MRGVTFDGNHSFFDWGLLLKTRPVVSPPAAKTKMVKVPGSSAAIDLTESLTDGARYDTRAFSAEFILTGRRETWEQTYSTILNALHGKKVQIILDDDREYYYTGRVSVGELETDNAVASLTITAECEPYKHEKYGNGVKL